MICYLLFNKCALGVIDIAIAVDIEDTILHHFAQVRFAEADEVRVMYRSGRSKGTIVQHIGSRVFFALVVGDGEGEFGIVLGVNE